jgi:hypothetical protein
VDIDNDGDLDIVGPCSSKSEGMHIFLGNGSESPGNDLGWTKATNIGLPTSGNWYGANTYDSNGDGSLDLVGASWGMGVRAWLNNISSDKTSPAAVTDLTVTDKTTDSITVKWTAPADNGTDAQSGPVQSYDIRYYTSQINPGTWTSAWHCTSEPVPAQPGTEQSYTVTGLSPATFYYIGLRSSDEMPNISPISNIVSDTTLGLPDDTMPGQINDLAAIEPTNNSIKLTWTAPADNGTDSSSGPAAEYDIRYHSVSITATNWAAAEKISVPPQPASPGTTETFIIDDLTAETTYFFAIKTRDERPNWSMLSNSPSETTLENPDLIAPERITDLKTQKPTTTTLELTWTAPGDDGDSGTASVYDIRFAETSIDDASWPAATVVIGVPVPSSQGSMELFEVTGLDPATVYYFAIKTADEVPLWSTLSNIAIGTTLAIPDETSPSKITDFTAVEPTAATIKLMWTAPGDDDGTGTAATYDIRYSKADITDGNWDAAAIVNNPPVPKQAGLAEAFVVSGLEIDTLYYFAVKSADEVPNLSPLSNIASATTLATPELTVEITPEKTHLNSSESIILYIQVADSSTSSPVSLVTVDIISDNSDVKLSSTSGETDSEGLLMITLTAPTVSEDTDVVIQVGAQKLGYETGTASLTLKINKIIEDLKFNLAFLRFDDVTPEADVGDEITVRALVFNGGPVKSGNFIIRVYLDDVQFGDDHSYSALTVAGDEIVEVIWQVAAGEHKFRFEIIPGEPARESNAGDNVMTLTYNYEPIDVEKPGDSGSESSDAGSNTLAVISAAIIIIVLVLILLLFIIVRKGKKEESAGGYGTYAPMGSMDETYESDTAEEDSGGEDLEEE